MHKLIRIRTRTLRRTLIRRTSMHQGLVSHDMSSNYCLWLTIHSLSLAHTQENRKDQKEREKERDREKKKFKGTWKVKNKPNNSTNRHDASSAATEPPRQIKILTHENAAVLLGSTLALPHVNTISLAILFKLIHFNVLGSIVSEEMEKPKQVLELQRIESSSSSDVPAHVAETQQHANNQKVHKYRFAN